MFINGLCPSLLCIYIFKNPKALLKSYVVTNLSHYTDKYLRKFVQGSTKSCKIAMKQAVILQSYLLLYICKLKRISEL